MGRLLDIGVASIGVTESFHRLVVVVVGCCWEQFGRGSLKMLLLLHKLEGELDCLKRIRLVWKAFLIVSGFQWCEICINEL
jgi:hypothetical protein